MSTSQPVVSMPSQSAKPARHASTQRDAAQPESALGREGQADPHIPQCDAVARTSTSQPFEAFMSQSPKPSLHMDT